MKPVSAHGFVRGSFNANFKFCKVELRIQIDIVLSVPPIHFIRLLHASPLNAQDEDVNEIKVARTSK